MLCFGGVCVAHLFSFLCCVFGWVRVSHLFSFLGCPITFLVPCYDVRYDFRVNAMFVSSLPPVVLFTLLVFVYV